MRHATLLTPIALSLAASLTAAPAAAQCVLDAGATPPTLTCAGTETAAQDEDIANLETTVDSGAEIDVSDDDALRLRGENNSVTVAGPDGGDPAGVIRATGGGDEAVQADESGFSLTNGGAIVSLEDKGVQADDENGTTVVNTGVIGAADEAVEARDGFMMLNDGVVVAGEDAVQFGDGALTNNGEIIGGADEATLEAATGEDFGPAAADGDGVDIDSGSIINNGVIRSDSPDDAAGIDVDEVTVDDDPITETLTIVNNPGAEIRGTLGVLVEPAGPTAGTLNETTQIIRNAGLIQGRGGVIMSLAAGDDEVWLLDGSTLLGDTETMGAGPGLVDLGPRDDLLGVSAFLGDTTGDALFDGGDGFDSFWLDLPLASTDIMISAAAAGLRLEFGAGGDETALTLRNFEGLRAADGRFLVAADGGLAPVPLPAALPMLAAGLGALAVLRRRRAA